MDKNIKRDSEKHERFSLITTAIKKFKSAETPEEIREDLKKEWSLAEDFFEIYEEKIDKIKKAVWDWKIATEPKIDESQEFIKDVYKKINPLLEKKIKALLAGIEGIDRKIFARIKRAYDLKDAKSKEQLEELQRNITYYTKQIRDNLSFLKKLYKHQTSYLRDKGAGQIEGDLEQHSFLYRTLTDELRVDMRLKRNIIGFLRLVQLDLGVDRRSSEYLGYKVHLNLYIAKALGIDKFRKEGKYLVLGTNKEYRNVFVPAISKRKLDTKITEIYIGDISIILPSYEKVYDIIVANARGELKYMKENSYYEASKDNFIRPKVTFDVKTITGNREFKSKDKDNPLINALRKHLKEKPKWYGGLTIKELLPLTEKEMNYINKCIKSSGLTSVEINRKDRTVELHKLIGSR